jgi:hypothetical protein
MGHRRSRDQRWRDAAAELTVLQARYAAWLASLPSSLQESTTAEALQAIRELELADLLAIRAGFDPSRCAFQMQLTCEDMRTKKPNLLAILPLTVPHSYKGILESSTNCRLYYRLVSNAVGWPDGTGLVMTRNSHHCYRGLERNWRRNCAGCASISVAGCCTSALVRVTSSNMSLALRGSQCH